MEEGLEDPGAVKSSKTVLSPGEEASFATAAEVAAYLRGHQKGQVRGRGCRQAAWLPGWLQAMGALAVGRCKPLARLMAIP